MMMTMMMMMRRMSTSNMITFMPYKTMKMRKGDVMGGSLILNRASPLHPLLSATIARLEDGEGLGGGGGGRGGL
jgi:hypothetical protein